MSSSNGAPVRIATTDGMGARIARTLGIVVGVAIRNRGISGNIMAGLDALGNGTALDEYRDLLAAIRREALARMERAALGIGANAIIGMRYDKRRGRARDGRDRRLRHRGRAPRLLTVPSPHAIPMTDPGPRF